MFLNKILVPLEGSPSSERALRYAAEERAESVKTLATSVRGER